MCRTGAVGEHGPVPDRYRVTFVCTGNICRSPMAETVLRRRAEQEGLGDVLDVRSSGTGDWHVGQPADRRAVAALAARGYDASGHRARQVTESDLDEHDLVVALDRGHLAALRAMARTPEQRARIRLLRSFDPDADDDEVADPYYGDDEHFDEVLDQIESAVTGILDHVRRATGTGDRQGSPS